MDLKSKEGLYRGATSDSIYYFYLHEKFNNKVVGFYLRIYGNKEFSYKINKSLSITDLKSATWTLARRSSDYHRLVQIIFSKKSMKDRNE